MAKMKLKTRRAAAKRFRVTGSGHVKVGQKGKRHIFTNKSRKRKRQLVGMKYLTGGDAAKAKSLLPYA